MSIKEKRGKLTSIAVSSEAKRAVLQSRRKMLSWPNPVEFVNNMYGSHSGMNGSDYFEKIFPRPKKK